MAPKQVMSRASTWIGCVCLGALALTACYEETYDVEGTHDRARVQVEEYRPPTPNSESEWREVETHPGVTWPQIKQCQVDNPTRKVCRLRRMTGTGIEVRGWYIPVAHAVSVSHDVTAWADANHVRIMASCNSLSLESEPRALWCKASDAPDLSMFHRFRDIEDLTLRGRYYNDRNMVHLAGMMQLREFDMHSDALRGEGVAHIAGSSGLQKLVLRGESLDDSALEQVGKFFPALESLWIDEGTFTAEGWRHLHDKDSLEKLSLPKNTSDEIILELLEHQPQLRIRRVGPESYFSYRTPRD